MLCCSWAEFQCSKSQPDSLSWDKLRKSPRCPQKNNFFSPAFSDLIQDILGIVICFSPSASELRVCRWWIIVHKEQSQVEARNMKVLPPPPPQFPCIAFTKLKRQQVLEQRQRKFKVCVPSYTYTSPRTSWDHYNKLLCHCHPSLVNLCQGHTRTVHTNPHMRKHTSNLHSYCHIYCMLTNTISHIPLNWIHRYTHASNLHLLENAVTSKLHMCAAHELVAHTLADAHSLNLLSVMVNNETRAGYTPSCTQVQSWSWMMYMYSHSVWGTNKHTASAHLHSCKKQTAAQTSSSEAAVAC